MVKAPTSRAIWPRRCSSSLAPGYRALPRSSRRASPLREATSRSTRESVPLTSGLKESRITRLLNLVLTVLPANGVWACSRRTRDTVARWTAEYNHDHRENPIPSLSLSGARSGEGDEAKAAGALFLVLAVEPAQQTNLPRVVDVMKRHAVDVPQEFLRTSVAECYDNGGAQGAVLSFQQRAVLAPGALAQFHRPAKKIAALQYKRPALPADEPPPHRVFPVRRMNGKLPDVVPARRRTPSGLPGRDSPEGLPQVWPVPGPFFISLIEKRKYQVLARHRVHEPSHRPTGCHDSTWSQITFNVAVIGIARSSPTPPHSHPQNSSEIVTASAFSRTWRPTMAGMRKFMAIR